MHHPRLTLLTVAFLTGACGTAGTPAPSTAGPTPSSQGPTAAPTTAPSEAPRPAGILPWPATFAVAMPPGTYFSAPPFEIPLTVAINSPGWYAGHLNPVFVDLQRYDGVAVGSFPTRLFGFGLPENIRGVDGAVPVIGLTPASAIDLLMPRTSLRASNHQSETIAGLSGERVDLASLVQNNPVFGSADGDFGIQPELDARLVLLPLGDGLLAIVLLAPPGELEAGWAEVRDMLASIELIASTSP
jgi:hypothetical protein